LKNRFSIYPVQLKTSAGKAQSKAIETNTALQASFVPTPFGPAAGTYEGLFYSTDTTAEPSSEFFSAQRSFSTAPFFKSKTPAMESFSGQTRPDMSFLSRHNKIAKWPRPEAPHCGPTGNGSASRL
jgi:hypothetical protein